MTRAAKAIAFAREDLGKLVYLLGAKPPLDGPVPSGTRSDCSGAIRRWLHRAGVSVPDGSVQQHEYAKEHGHEVPVSVALGMLGAGCLLFIVPYHGHPGHVALSLGNGETIECRGSKGSCIVGAKENARRGWTAGAKLEAMWEEWTP
jgi:cell wall-associated NlpC family hydrolase